jgi:hypothetical protein
MQRDVSPGYSVKMQVENSNFNEGKSVGGAGFY